MQPEWITEMPDFIETNVVIKTLQGEIKFGSALTRYDREGRPIELIGQYGLKPTEKIRAYMRVPTLDENPADWHGDYTDGKDPPAQGWYLVTVETRPGHYTLRTACFDGKGWPGAGEVIGWRRFPAK